jgi:hypothetical protein
MKILIWNRKLSVKINETKQKIGCLFNERKKYEVDGLKSKKFNP